MKKDDNNLNLPTAQVEKLRNLAETINALHIIGTATLFGGCDTRTGKRNNTIKLAIQLAKELNAKAGELLKAMEAPSNTQS